MVKTPQRIGWMAKMSEKQKPKKCFVCNTKMGEHLRVNGSLQKHKNISFYLKNICTQESCVCTAALATTTSTKKKIIVKHIKNV